MTAVNGIGGKVEVAASGKKPLVKHEQNDEVSIFNKKFEHNRAHATGGIVASSNIGNYLNGSAVA